MRLQSLCVRTMAVLLAFAGLTFEARAKVFDPTTFTLDNGMQVVVVTNDRAPIVSHMVWYKVGAADEAPGESGVAHLLEHLMFKGTDTLAPGEFSEIVAKNGGRENAFTSWDYTGYYQVIAREHLELMMKHEADRMVNLTLTSEIVVPELEVVREERRSRIDNEPAAELNEAMRGVQYYNHPYRRPIIGWDHELVDLDAETALDFYRKWYAPNNAILVVAGDVEPEEVRSLAETYYGPIEPADVPARVRPKEPPQEARRRATIESPQVAQPSLTIDYLAPSYATAEGATGYALQVLSEIMGGGATSRLYKSLVVEDGLAVSAGTSYSGNALDYGGFTVYASPRQGVDMADLEAAVREEIGKLLEEGIAAEEVEVAKRRLKAQAVYARDDLMTAPRVLGMALVTGRTVADVEAWPERIGAVTVEQVTAAAREVLDDGSSVTGLLLSKPTT